MPNIPSLVLTLCAISALSLKSHAQSLQYELHAGINQATLLIDDRENNFISGLQLGGKAIFSLTEQFALSGGLSFNQLGGKGLFVADTGEEGSLKIGFSYLYAPFQFEHTIQNKVKIGAGFYAAYLLNLTTQIHTPIPIELLTLNRADFNRIDYGINASIGYFITDKLLIEGALLVGIREVEQAAIRPFLRGLEHTALGLSLAYRFGGRQ
jgi:hypothetical protein